MATQSPKLPTTVSRIDRKSLNAKEHTCIFCGKVFSSKVGLGWHLPHCKKRGVLRIFATGGIVFYAWLNPRKDVMKALRRMETEVKDAKEFLGALRLLQFYGYVQRHHKETMEQAIAAGRYDPNALDLIEKRLNEEYLAALDRV